MPPTATTARDLTGRAPIKESMMKAKSRSSWDGYGRADNGGQQPKLLVPNIKAR